MADNWLSLIIEGLANMSGWEASAALLGLGYVILASIESKWCWLAALLSTIIYTILFWQGQLLMHSLLNFYYIGMAIYGFWVWRKHQQANADLHIHTWPISYHALFIIIGGILTAVTTYYLTEYNFSKKPFLDASTTVFAVMNTWLMARKILENWLYWIFIDGASVVLFSQTGFYATIGLFIIYVILAVFGFFAWYKIFKSQSTLPS